MPTAADFTAQTGTRSRGLIAAEGGSNATLSESAEPRPPSADHTSRKSTDELPNANRPRLAGAARSAPTGLSAPARSGMHPPRSGLLPYRAQRRGRLVRCSGLHLRSWSGRTDEHQSARPLAPSVRLRRGSAGRSRSKDRGSRRAIAFQRKKKKEERKGRKGKRQVFRQSNRGEGATLVDEALRGGSTQTTSHGRASLPSPFRPGKGSFTNRRSQHARRPRCHHLAGAVSALRFG